MGGFEAIGEAVKSAVNAVASDAGTTILLFALALIFAWGGLAKLRAPGRAALALYDFGLASRPRPVLGGVAGAVELGIATGLAAGAVQPGLATAAATVALLVLIAFVVLEVRSLRDGRRFACFCFGDESAEISWASVARTACLAVVAATALVAGPAAEAQPAASVVSELAIAAGATGVCALLGTWPRLRKWREDPLGLRDELWIERGGA